MEKIKMTEWKEVKLGDVCLDVSYGYTASATSEKIGPKFLRITDVVPYFIHWDDVPYCNIPEDLLERYLLKKGDIVIARTGATSGYNAVIDNDIKAVYASYLIRFRPNPENVFSFFMKYVLKSEKYKDFIKSNVSGSAQPGINAQVLSQFSFSLPPLEIQRKIAGILGALDDKIEVLREQNKTLEQMAQAVFQSWFVDFDIVRAKAANMPTEDICKKYHITPDLCALFPATFTPDNLPLGWEKIPFSETMDIISGGTPKTTEASFWNGEIPWYSVVDAPASVYVLDTEKHITGLGLEKSPCSLLEKDTVIISARGTVGKLAIVGKPMAMNQSCYGLKFDFPYYGYLMTKQMLVWLKQNVHGAVFDTITKDTFKTVQTINVSRDLKEAFTNIVSSFFNKVYENSKQIRTLEQTRDTLLPKLMKGGIDVNDVCFLTSSINVEEKHEKI
ncbi:MAG: restriction endonuclease subunit S [Alphaproteobacteria bacterium]|nr:restriction endonuclease subunit S [Alphaproteobacteria bacterium]